MSGDESDARLILRYFHSWQEPSDFEEFRACLADDVVFDSNFGVVTGADALTEMVRRNESPWEDVTLLGSIFSDGSGALFYDGTDKATRERTRVGEHLTVRHGRIYRVTAVICLVKAPDPF